MNGLPDQATTVLTVSQLTSRIRQTITLDHWLADCFVAGEISNFTRHSRGHMYFTLKDEQSKVKAVMFAGRNRALPFVPRDGMSVIARGNVDVYERDGQYQLYVQELQPAGIGALYLAFTQLKERLEAEGLFDVARKRTLPTFPRVVGVVTSDTGAVIRDIVTTLRRRCPLTHVLLHPVPVQGNHAPRMIAEAIGRMNAMAEEHRIDVLIVGRGGGSLEELWAFNDEGVARAIHTSALPVISAVGHETDVTISDFVADMRAPTPTAAAELAAPNLREWITRINTSSDRAYRAVGHTRRVARERLERAMRSPALSRPRDRVLQSIQRVDQLEREAALALARLASRNQRALTDVDRRLAQSSPGDRIQKARAALEQHLSRLGTRVRVRLTKADHRFARSLDKLDALSPLAVLRRGYALVYAVEGQQLVRSVNEVDESDFIRIRLTDGWITGTVHGKETSGGTDR